jgi:N-acetylglucosaminyldiphosphoundecaprenol N-acetyl-beta-D-mannosaminyltransferase
MQDSFLLPRTSGEGQNVAATDDIEDVEASAVPRFDRRVYCLLGLPIDGITADEAVTRIAQAVKSRAKYVWSTPNLNNLVASQNDPDFREMLLRSDLLTADGMPLVILSRMLSIPITERVAGSSIFERLMHGAASSIRVYFFGGTNGVVERACSRLSVISNSMRCVGYRAPGFGPVEDMCVDEFIAAINAAKPDLLVLAVGTQRGHEWIRRSIDRLSVPVVAHLGSVINFVAGTVRRAPYWLQRTGLEWLWRIIEEPRLWRRYLLDFAALLRLCITRVLPAIIHQIITAPSELHVNQAQFSVKCHGSNWVFQLEGALVERNLQCIRDAFANAVSERADLVLDFARVSYIDSAAIGLIMIARGHQARRGRSLRIVSVTPGVRRILRLHCADYLLSREPPKLTAAGAPDALPCGSCRPSEDLLR